MIGEHHLKGGPTSVLVARRSVRTLVAPVTALLLLLLGHFALAQQGEATLERGRAYTQQFYAGELEPLFARFSAEFADVIGGEAGLRAFRDGFLADVGQEVEVLAEEVLPHPGAEVYQRVVMFEHFGSAVAIEWALDPEGTVLGMFIGPAAEPEAAPSAYLDYETKTELRLPFQGEWLVGWGGRSTEENYHAAYPDQRFAYDFLVADLSAIGDTLGSARIQRLIWLAFDVHPDPVESHFQFIFDDPPAHQIRDCATILQGLRQHRHKGML